MDGPHTYKEWKQAVLHRQQQYIHIKVCLDTFKLKPQYQKPTGWSRSLQNLDPNAMDMSTGHTRGCVTGSEEFNPNEVGHTLVPPHLSRGGFMQRQRGSNMGQVKCYLVKRLDILLVIASTIQGACQSNN